MCCENDTNVSVVGMLAIQYNTINHLCSTNKQNVLGALACLEHHGETRNMHVGYYPFGIHYKNLSILVNAIIKKKLNDQ